MKKTHKIISLNSFISVLSDDTIKEGDWFVDNNHGTSQVVKATSNIVVSANIHKTLCKKIIATTDPKLNYRDLGSTFLNESQYGLNGRKGYLHLPSIPQPLVEYYAKHQPEEVELEYEITYHATYDQITQIIKLKLQNNEVVWDEPDKELNLATNKFYMEKAMRSHESVEGKLYTREEVERILLTFREDHIYTFDMTSEEMVKQWIKEWIKENL